MYRRAITLPTEGRIESEHRLHNLRKKKQLKVQFEPNESQKASDRPIGTAGRGDHTPSDSAAGPSCPISITATQIEKGPDKADIMCNCAPLPSVAGQSRPIPVYIAGNDFEQRKETGDSEGHLKLVREGDSNAWTPEMIELVIQKLKDITDTSWQMKDEYDNHIEALHAKLIEQELLIDQLKEHTMMLRQELKGPSIGVHWFYDDFLFHMRDSIESVQALRDMALCIHNDAITTSGGSEDKKKNQGASRRRWHRTRNRKGKAKSST